MLLNEISLRSGFTMKSLRCLLDIIYLNEIKYARKSIYFVFLVWMGQSIHRASCTKAVMRLALRPRNGCSYPHKEHMKKTYNLICTEINLKAMDTNGKSFTLIFIMLMHMSVHKRFLIKKNSKHAYMNVRYKSLFLFQCKANSFGYLNI